MTTTIQPALLTVREASDFLRISPRTLATLTKRGDLGCVRIGKSVRYSVDSLRRYVAQQEVPGTVEA